MSAERSASAPDGDERALAVLAEGDVAILGRIVPSSNLALLVEVSAPEATLTAVYKPEAGERPLWDFDPGLHRREVAAYLLSDWLGWNLVPPTVAREDAPAGTGSLQLFIESDPAEHYFTLFRRRPEVLDDLMAMAVFDVVANNADRKSGHVLRGPDGRVYGIDHGLCFAAEDKLRTVIWDFSGEAVPADLLDGVARLRADLPPGLSELLSEPEVDALQARVRRLLVNRSFPVDRSGRRIPWPLV